MPTINIKELDKTSAVASAIDNNVVYVPGFSAKVIDILRKHTKKDASGAEVEIPNAIIFDESGDSVETGKLVDYGEDKQRAYNIADKLVWECDAKEETIVSETKSATSTGEEQYLQVKAKSTGAAPDFWNTLLPYLYTLDGGQHVPAKTYTNGATYELKYVPGYSFNQTKDIRNDIFGILQWADRSVSGIAVKATQGSGDLTFDNLEVTSGKMATLDVGVASGTFNTSEAFKDLVSSTNVALTSTAGVDNTNIEISGEMMPVADVYFMPTIAVGTDNQDTAYSSLEYKYSGTEWTLLSDIEYDAPDMNEAVEFIATTKEQDFIDTFGGAPYIFTEAQPYPVNGANSFSELAYSTNNDVIVEKGSPDKSYIYARELLNAGLSVIYEAVVEFADSTEESYLAGYPVGAKLVKLPSVQYLYKRFTGDENNDNIFKALTDKGTHNIKFITSGGYPTFEYGSNAAVTAMNTAAVDRGDVVVLIDPTDYPGRTLKPSKNSGSVFDVVNNSKNDNLLSLQGPTSDKGGAYATMVPVWIKYTAPTYGSLVSMPGSFAYLISYANSVRTYADWLAIAGVARGIIPNCQGINSFHVLTNSIAEAYQAKTGISINPITYIRGYGYAIWGNRTLLNNNGLTASSFLNLRSLVCDVKKTVYAACRRYMFEQNNDVLWVSFKAAITPTLEKMVAGYGIESYKIVKLPTREKAKIVAEIILTPIYAVEDFEVTIVLTDSELTVE